MSGVDDEDNFIEHVIARTELGQHVATGLAQAFEQNRSAGLPRIDRRDFALRIGHRRRCGARR